MAGRRLSQKNRSRREGPTTKRQEQILTVSKHGRTDEQVGVLSRGGSWPRCKGVQTTRTQHELPCAPRASSSEFEDGQTRPAVREFRAVVSQQRLKSQWGTPTVRRLQGALWGDGGVHRVMAGHLVAFTPQDSKSPGNAGKRRILPRAPATPASPQFLEDTLYRFVGNTIWCVLEGNSRPSSGLYLRKENCPRRGRPERRHRHLGPRPVRLRELTLHPQPPACVPLPGSTSATGRLRALAAAQKPVTASHPLRTRHLPCLGRGSDACARFPHPRPEVLQGYLKLSQTQEGFRPSLPRSAQASSLLLSSGLRGARLPRSAPGGS